MLLILVVCTIRKEQHILTGCHKECPDAAINGGSLSSTSEVCMSAMLVLMKIKY
jgi:hypothetical protein